MAVVPRDQAEQVLTALVAKGYTATVCDSRGGIMRQAQHIFFVAVPEMETEHVLSIIRENCRPEPPRQPLAGDQTEIDEIRTAIFTWDLEKMALV
jgi:uncharacterized protein YaaQ